MPIRRIYKYGEKILEKKTRKVDFAKLKGELPSLLADMFETMDAEKGLGLSANQIGLDLRLSVVKIRNENDEDLRIVLINPEIVESSGSLYKEEGCLSFPGLFARVKRFSKVKVRAFNEKGLPIEINADELLARTLQHEIDHLDGIVFISRLPFTTRLRLKPALFKLKKQWKKIDESDGRGQRTGDRGQS